MALFPFFVDIQEKKGMIIGGGNQALEKIKRLLPYCSRLIVFAETFKQEITEIAEIQLVHRSFQESDLEDRPAFVVAAAEDREENRRIAGLCRERRVLVNVVDDPDYCDFIFPSLIQYGDLSIGICTGGASPSTGVLLKKKIQAQIPDQMEAILDFLQEKRPVIIQALKEKKKRFAFFYQLSEICMSNGRPLSEEEFCILLSDSLSEESTDNC